MKITPVLFLEAIEPALDFWVERLGFVRTIEVPHDDKLGFVALTHDTAEVMLQTFESAKADSEAAGAFAVGCKCALYIEVPDFHEIISRLGDWPVEMAVRDTFYGMREVGVLAPGGHSVVFAAPIAGLR